uniref:Cytochrome c oxidase subunit n=1 Tax=Thalassionema nitzschioides TaxID=33649 RepID=A0A6V1BKT9_9STRA|mmetsp:Transcript_6393/g.9411  ORF Transcript_6393/g.9411 Transcript_6393/m.9411 type:complete len:142 (+) Transcript_6393:79-504(+)
MIAARRLAVRSAFALTQRRSAQTVPKFATEQAMKEQANEQIRARLAYQKELRASSGAHSHAEEVDEMWKWIKISFIVALPVCALSCVKDLIFEEHHHDDGGPKPDYMKIRKKEFPWECEDCALFDQKCWNACRAERAAEGA